MRWIAICSMAIVLGSCQPRPDYEARVRDLIVKTVNDNSVDFSSYATYSLALDTIGVFWAFAPDSIIVDDYAPLISRAVKANLDKAGYKQVSPGQQPDLAVNVLLSRGYSVNKAFPNPNYYYKRPGNYSYKYSGYGGYSPYPYVIPSYESATSLIVEIIDLKNKDAQQRVRFIWSAFLGDVDATSDPMGKSKEAVDQAFVQSPYIRKQP